jgi:tetratricopeptide (TPR) repeat protein
LTRAVRRANLEAPQPRGCAVARPLCFVLMPFGKKPDGAGGSIDFDAVYAGVIAPAIAAADLEPLRADEEQTGGIIHKAMFERLLLCEYAVADLTTANPNVFYELGVRHALRPWSTVLIYAAGGRLPFDVAPQRALPYGVSPSGTPSDVEGARRALEQRLEEARERATDSPLFQLIDGLPAPEIDRTKTDVFRDQVRYSAELKDRLARARDEGVEAVRAVEVDLGAIEDTEAEVVIDLFLSYRAAKAWPEMIALVDKMAPPLASTAMVREQLALALNRAGQGERAERELLELLDRRGPSSETYGILGRVYKDRWLAATNNGSATLARGLLERAIDAYTKGFEADWRDAYPGINAVTLLEIRDPTDSRIQRLLPVVRYAVERRVARGDPDYWDFATLLELAVIARDQDAAATALAAALAAVREPWEPESTAKNLRMIREARAERGEAVPWAEDLERELLGVAVH